MGDPWASPDPPQPGRRSGAETAVTVVSCVVVVGLLLSGLSVLGVMVLTWVGSIRLFPNK